MSKRKTLDLGHTLDRGTAVAFPNELAARRLAVFGISGSGKSNTATVILEGLIRNGEQVVLVDPKGEGWGLRVGADGKPGGGLDVVVFGEPRGDLPLDEAHAEQVADFAVDTGQSIVLSLQGFDTDQAERRTVARFMRRLYRRKSKQAHPIRTMVALDEAHLFVPEAGRVSGDVSEVVSSIRRIGRQGRSAGLGLMVIDQRPQDVANSVITQSELLICHGLVHETDRRALREWVKGYDRGGQGEQFLETVAQLEPGQAWVWSPAWLKLFDRVRVRRRDTFDSASTPDGSRGKRSVKLAPVDLDQLRGQLELVVQAAEAADPDKLRRELAAARKARDTADRQLASVTAERDELRDRPALDPAELERRLAAERDRVAAELTQAWREHTATVRANLSAVDDQLRGLLNGQAPKPTTPAPQRPSRPARAAATKAPAAPPSSPATPSRGGGGAGSGSVAAAVADPPSLKLGKRHRQVLDTIAWWNSVGVVSPNWPQIASLIGSHPNTKTLTNARGELKSAGLIEDDYRLTSQGAAYADAPDERPTLAHLHDAWRSRFSTKERALFDAVIDGGGELDWQSFADDQGFHPNTKTWTNARGRLNKTFGVTRSAGGKLIGTDLMYPEGLA